MYFKKGGKEGVTLYNSAHVGGLLRGKGQRRGQGPVGDEEERETERDGRCARPAFHKETANAHGGALSVGS